MTSVREFLLGQQPVRWLQCSAERPSSSVLAERQPSVQALRTFMAH